MRALDIPFDERMHPFGSEDFGSFSPSATVPCLQDGELVIWDSLAIVETLAEHHPAVWPAQRLARAWARAATAEMHSGFGALREQCSMTCGVRIRLHEVGPALARDLARLEALWTDGLARFGGTFLAGERFTAVDAFFAPVAFRIQTYGLELSPGSLHYAARLRDLPAMTEWYEEALAETWRDPPHDDELACWGEVVEDHRAR
ncbi:MAG: glutathione S-transferase [Proteobacteria bacterium]|nr:glutathione S-transferase [Pseudomonadota bacterium]MCP4921668.1 glutathione S-transferase [Pseudomonadota bacterium]